MNSNVPQVTMEQRSLIKKASELEIQIEVQNRQGLMLAETQRYGEALACYNCVLRLREDNFPAWYGRGTALANLRQYQAALLSFDRAIAINPCHYEVWVFRAVVLIHLKRYQEALANCEQALALQPDDWEALTFRGVAFYYLGQYKRAYENYDRATGRTAQPWKLFAWLKKLLYRFQPDYDQQMTKVHDETLLIVCQADRSSCSSTLR